MSRSIKILLIIVTMIVQCVNVNISPKKKDNKGLVVNDNKRGQQVAQVVYFKSFKSYNLLWCRLDNLKQWKRRRRMYLFSRKFAEKTGKLRKKRSSLDNISEQPNGLQSKDLAKPKTSRPISLVARFMKVWPVSNWRKYLFTDDYLLLINRHWLYFPPPNPSVHYILGGIYIVIFIVGCSGNALVLLMYIRCRTLRTPGNILVANLALSDFLMLVKTPVFIFNSFNFGPALGKTGCVIYGFLGGLTGTTSIATLSAIALDRYWAVVHPLEQMRALTTIRARILAIVSWLYAALFAIVPALDIGYGHYVPEGYLTSCSFDYLTEELPPRYFIFIFFCGAWVAPFCTISFCYLSIFRVVVCNRNISTNNKEQRLSTRHVKERAKRKAEIKLAFLVMAVIALFFISWTPYSVVALLGIFGKKNLITPLSSMIPALFCKTAACINPFIYIITHPNFRKEFRKLLFREKSKQMGGTIKTMGYYTDATKIHRPSKDLSDIDVEIVEMKDIPYQVTELDTRTELKLKTISSKLSERGDSKESITLNTFDSNAISPPSWYVKPKFAKKKSFSRQSSVSIEKPNSDIII